MKRSLCSFSWLENGSKRLAASCLDIFHVLGLLITLPNPLSSLKHPQGSSALHAEPCKAKNNEGHSLGPHPMSEDAQRQHCSPQAPFGGGNLGPHPCSSTGPCAKSNLIFLLQPAHCTGIHQEGVTPHLLPLHGAPSPAKLRFPMVSSCNSLRIPT